MFINGNNLLILRRRATYYIGILRSKCYCSDRDRDGDGRVTIPSREVGERIDDRLGGRERPHRPVMVSSSQGRNQNENEMIPLGLGLGIQAEKDRASPFRESPGNPGSLCGYSSFYSPDPLAALCTTAAQSVRWVGTGLGLTTTFLYDDPFPRQSRLSLDMQPDMRCASSDLHILHLQGLAGAAGLESRQPAP
jgi:hypothetical protein